MEDIFTPDNTRWENHSDDEGHTWQELEYTGDVQEACEEYGVSEDEFYELLEAYEEESRDLIISQREIDEARKGQY